MPPRAKNPTLRLIGALSLGLVLFSAALGLGAVWLRQQMAACASGIRQQEQRLAELRRSAAELEARVAAASTVDVLVELNRRHALGLVPTTEPQIVRVDVPVTHRLQAKRNQEIFAPLAMTPPLLQSPRPGL